MFHRETARLAGVITDLFMAGYFLFDQLVQSSLTSIPKLPFISINGVGFLLYLQEMMGSPRIAPSLQQ